MRMHMHMKHAHAHLTSSAQRRAISSSERCIVRAETT